MPVLSHHEDTKKSFFSFTSEELMKQHLIPTAGAGMLDRMIFHPWETVITLKQDSGKNVFNVAHSHSKAYGLKSFYQGYTYNVLAAIPIRVSIFGTYSFIKEQGQYTQYSPMMISLAAGCFTGFLESSILNPVDAYRVRKTLPATAGEAFHWRLLYKGYGSLLLRTSVENTVCLLGTDVLMDSLSKETQQKAQTRFYCAFIAGAASQFLSTPFDTVKTRKMKEPHLSYKGAITSLYQEGGRNAFFRSTLSKAARAGVCNAMMLGTTPFIRNMINQDVASTHPGPI